MDVLFDRPEEDAPARPEVPDPLSEILGQRTYVRTHRFEGLYVEYAQGAHSPRLSVSRFYWEAEPPLVLDFVREIRGGEAEIRAKTAYCAERGIRYLVLADQYDAERLAERLAELDTPPADIPADEPKRPVVGPSRRARGSEKTPPTTTRSR